jgi:signal transduction histidine kinase
MLSTNTNLTADNKEYVDLIKKSCSNALMFTKDLLTVATAGDEQLVKEKVDINELVRTNVGLLKFRAASKNQQIEFKVLKHAIPVQVNVEKITRVINNIVTNAIKFSPQYTTIHVVVEQEIDGVQISIRDEGIGIPDAIKGKVFDILTEAKRFGTSGEEPYGLGLSISKQIIDAHGGRIWFESVDGNGTTFYIYLPVTKLA